MSSVGDTIGIDGEAVHFLTTAPGQQFSKLVFVHALALDEGVAIGSVAV